MTSIRDSVVGKKIKILSKAKNIKKSAESKKSDFIKAKTKGVSKTDFVTSKARVAFTQMKKTFIKILIFCYLNLKCHIWI